MTNGNIELLELTKNDCQLLPTLLTKVWGKKTDKEYWEWKYFSPHFDTYGVVIKKEKKIISLNGFWIRPVMFKNTLSFPYMSIDTMTDPQFQGKQNFKNILGVFSQLLENTLVWGFTNEVSHSMFKTAFGHIVIFDSYFSVFKLPMNAGSFLPKMGFANKLGNKISQARVSKRLSTIHETDFVIHKVTDITDDFDQLWDNVHKDYLWIPCRNKAYLQWRFINNQNGQYHIWKIMERKKNVGYIASSIKMIKTQKTGFIVDWLVPEGRTDLFESLLVEAFQWLQKNQVDVIEIWLLNHQTKLREIINSYFFKKTKRRETFLCCGAKDALEGKELTVDDIYITMGDSDYLANPMSGEI